MTRLFARIACLLFGHAYDDGASIDWCEIESGELRTRCRCGAVRTEIVREGVEHRYRCAS